MNAPKRGGGTVTIIGDLPMELGKLFGSPGDINMIVTDAGLDAGVLAPFGLAAAMVWTAILVMLDQLGINAVIQAAQRILSG